MLFLLYVVHKSKPEAVNNRDVRIAEWIFQVLSVFCSVFGSVLKNRRFGFLCRLVVKYKKRVSWRALLLSQYCTVLTVLSDSVRNVKNVKAL